MKKFYLIGFGILLLFDTLGQTSFKLAATAAEPLAMSMDWVVRVFTNVWVYVAIFGYIVTFLAWMTLLRHAPVGPAFAAAHMEVVTVMIVSIWLFNDHITLGRFLGALLIVIGIICLAFAEKQAMALEVAEKAKASAD
ncbi:DMT family transporter [Wohlfahrtiimonas chitiniclastica]|uniref:DMT family transporter n=1 Tax=Wohlfahrtiimonas chitiniclastica TaxID=400946 RepID=UPI000B992F4F|nr:EamA family transporter [Wohlfahrtiimonas chitiniclastica]MBS7816887.1 EamA family transporter [Wohlfahrtiimonas chitiniclastica]MBS7822220.1 EamA family transporter [Wohlfahrtiimonas chitiniclastica]MBS7830282.1 EamA family transporter [Wohlfahrtiimonas chitiniclastica]MBS7832250.1 EamA family transporter [Wohlfahrtiimonas chitiniclastica]OYQ78394.1 EamA family transporter [Wohlfahrtiimonas chitiniclastica]